MEQETRAVGARGARRAGGALLVLGVAAVIAGIVLMGVNIGEDRSAGKAAPAVLAQVREQIPPTTEEPAAGEDDPSELPVLPDYVLDPQMPLPTVEVDGHLYVGTLSIPAIDVELPVIDHWSEADKKLLKIAPCRYVGTPYARNMIIAGHNYASHLGRLKNLVPGDEVRFTDVAGNVFRYHVVGLETIPTRGVAQMLDGEYDYDLTVFTCTIGGASRVTVRCMEDVGG